MQKHHFAICVHHGNYEASLELRKLYEVLSDPEAEEMGQIRVIDESGEDYLYPKDFFVSIELPEVVETQILHAA